MSFIEATPFHSGSQIELGHSNLYVTRLPLDIHETQLHDAFSSFGAVISLKIFRSFQNPAKNPFAFVKLQSVRSLNRNNPYYPDHQFSCHLIHKLEEAQSAILKLNGSNLGGSFIEVRMADHDMDQEQMGAHPEELQSDNLYCKNLPSSYTDMDVRCLFEPFGSVLTCRVLHHGDLTGLGGAALIRLSSVEEAANAIRDLNGHQIPGSYHPLIVKYADNSDAKAKKSATRSLPLPSIVQPLQQGYHPPQRHNPYGSLSAAASAAAAVVASQQHLLAPHYGGFGGAHAFINTSQYSAAQYPYSNPQQAMVDPLYQSIFPLGSSSSLGHQMAAGPSSPGPQVSLSVASLYIKNLPLDADRLFLYEKFAPYGAILSVKVLYDDHGTSKGIGFVNYAMSDSAQKAAAALNNLPVGDRCLQISFQTRRKV